MKILPFFVVVFILLLLSPLLISATTLIIDVSGSAGDLAALRLLAATPGTQISLITVCGNCGTSPLAAWSRVRRFANWIGLRSVKVVLGSSKSWYDREQLEKSDDVASSSSSSSSSQPTCRDNSGFLAPTSSPFASFPVPGSFNPANSETIIRDDISDWGNLFNTFDLDSWFGMDEEMPSSTMPSSWLDSSMMPDEVMSSSSATGSFITSKRLSSPAAVAIREFLVGSAVKVKILVLSSSMTNVADYLRAEQDIEELQQQSQTNNNNGNNLQSTISKISEIHAKGGCFDASACIFKSLTGNSPKLTTSAKQKGEWNFAMDPLAAEYIFSSSPASSSSSSSWTTKFGAIPKFLYTDDMMYFGTLMTTSDWSKITTRLKNAESVFQQAGGGATTARSTQFGGTDALVWLGKSFSAVEENWMARASDFVLTSGSGFLNVFRISEMFIALAVIDPSVRSSLEQQVDTQPKRNLLLGSVDVGGVQQEVAGSRQFEEDAYPTRSKNDVRVFTRGPSSTIPFWQSVSRYFFGFV